MIKELKGVERGIEKLEWGAQSRLGVRIKVALNSYFSVCSHLWLSHRHMLIIEQ